MTNKEILQIIAGLAGSVGFAILFNIRGKRLIATAVGGFISWLLYVIIHKFIENEAVVYLIVSALISVYAEVMARVLKTPTTTFTITSLVPLIPGGSLYYTMTSLFRADRAEFMQRAGYTAQLAAALALGIVAVTGATRLLYRILALRKKMVNKP